MLQPDESLLRQPHVIEPIGVAEHHLLRDFLRDPGEISLAVPLSGTVAIHDSCVYARYEGVIDEPRRLLASTGLSVAEPKDAGSRTCAGGGPA